MRRRAFTLVELLVVVGVIALLAALLAPSLGRARSLARSAVCQSNLHQIQSGLGVYQGRAQADGGSSAYPAPDGWPLEVYGPTGSDAVFICPEDHPSGGDAMLVDWTVKVPYNYQGVPFVITMEPPSFGAVKRPADGYVEYAFENTPWQAGYNNPSRWGDDGRFRVYDMPNGGKKIVMMEHDYPESHRSYMRGQPLFPKFGDVDIFQVPIGESVIIGGITSYAIDARISVPKPAPGAVVLVDYDTSKGMIADPSKDISAELITGARHLGKNNALMADGAVRTFGPTALDPRVSPELWQP